MVRGEAGESRARSRDFVGQGSGLFAGAGLADEDVLSKAAANRHCDTADCEGRAVIAISPLTSKHLVAYLRRREEGPVGGAVARAKGCCLELLVIRVNIFDDAAEVVSAERWDAKRTENRVQSRRSLGVPGREGQRDTPVVETAFDLVVNRVDSSNVYLKAVSSGVLQKVAAVALTFTRRQPGTAEGLATWLMEKGVAA